MNELFSNASFISFPYKEYEAKILSKFIYFYVIIYNANRKWNNITNTMTNSYANKLSIQGTIRNLGCSLIFKYFLCFIDKPTAEVYFFNP